MLQLLEKMGDRAGQNVNPLKPILAKKKEGKTEP